MPRYQQATPFDIVRSVKGAQNDIRTLQVAASPGLVRKPLNSHAASLNVNPYFWGMDPTGWAATAGTFTIVSDPPDPAPYPYAALYVNDGSGAGALMQSSSPFLVIAGQQYQVQANINTNASSIQLGIDWQDGSHTPVTGPTDPTITVTPNTWTLVSTIQQAPTGAVYGYPRVGSPSADFGQTYATGIITQPTAAVIQPGTSPPVVETWHDLPSGINSWGLGTGGWKKYKMTVDGLLALSISLRAIGTKTDGTNMFGAASLPTGYVPSSGRFMNVSMNVGGATFWEANHTPFLLIGADGSISCFGVNAAGLSQLDCHGVMPLI